MRRRSLKALSAMMRAPLRHVSPSFVSPIVMKARQAGMTTTTRTVMETIVEQGTAPPEPQVYEARDVEIRFEGKRLDLGADGRVSYSRKVTPGETYEVKIELRRPALNLLATMYEPRVIVDQGRDMEERARRRGELTEYVSEDEAKRRGFDV